MAVLTSGYKTVSLLYWHPHIPTKCKAIPEGSRHASPGTPPQTLAASHLRVDLDKTRPQNTFDVFLQGFTPKQCWPLWKPRVARAVAKPRVSGIRANVTCLTITMAS